MNPSTQTTNGHSEFFLTGASTANHSTNPSSSTVPPQSSQVSDQNPLHIRIAQLVAQPGREHLPRLNKVDGPWFKSRGVRKKISSIFQCTIDGLWIKYKTIPDENKFTFISSFAQYYNWAPGETTVVITAYHKYAARLYSNHLHTWKQKWLDGEEAPAHLKDKPCWNMLIEHWKSEPAQAESTRNSTNRKSNRNGNGISTQNGGATSTFQRKQDLMKKLGYVPDDLLILTDRHTNKRTNTVDDPYVADVIAKVKEKVNIRLSQLPENCSGESNSLPIEEINEICDEIIPIKKGRRLGFGEVSSYDAGISTSQSNTSSLEREVIELRETVITLKETNEECNQRMQTYEERTKRLEEMFSSMVNNGLNRPV